MRRNLLSRIPAGVGAGRRIADLGEWGILGSVILATTATGTHGPGALINDGLSSGLRYVPVLISRSDPAFMLYPDGSYDGPVPSSAVYALYEEGVGVAPGSPGTITIATVVSAPTITLRLQDQPISGAALPSLTGIQWGWWDSATSLIGTFGVAPVNSGAAESTNSDGDLVLEAPNSTRTSGQQAFVMLHLPGDNPRTFGALLTVD